MYFDPLTKEKIIQNNRFNETPYCNKTDFVKIEIINRETTKLIIPGGKFKPTPIRSKRSILHFGLGKTNVFQWENWQRHGSIKIPTWYIITIINGPMRTKKTEIHFVLEQQTSYLTLIPDLLLSNILLPNRTIMAYRRGRQYCERITTAKISMYNTRNLKQKNYEECYEYHNNTKNALNHKTRNANMQ